MMARISLRRPRWRRMDVVDVGVVREQEGVMMKCLTDYTWSVFSVA